MRQSFWLTIRAVPSLTTSAESPPGPSVMLVSTWIATRRSPASVSSSPSRVRTMLVEAERPDLPLELVRRVAGDAAPWCRGSTCSAATAVEVVAVEVGDVEVVRVLDPLDQLRRRADRCAGRRTTIRRTRAGTTGRTGSTRGRTRSGSRRARASGAHSTEASDAIGTSRRARRRQATGGSVYCWPARDTCSVQVLPSQ